MRYRPSQDLRRPYQYPVAPDARPVARLSLVEHAPPIGAPADHPLWRNAFVVRDLSHVEEVARLTAVNHGLDAHTVASLPHLPELRRASDPALRTTVMLLCQLDPYHGAILRFRFRCDEPDMARVRAQSGPPLTRDHVSIVIDMAGTGERPVEWCVNAAGELLRRAHFRFRDIYAAEEAVVRWSHPPATGTGQDPGAFDAAQPRGNAPESRASVAIDDSGWTVDGQIPLSAFGEPPVVGNLYCANLYSTRQVCPQGIVQGSRFHLDRYCWSPVHRELIEPGRFGFFALGDVDENQQPSMIARLDANFRAAQRARDEYEARKTEQADAVWRDALERRPPMPTQWLAHAVPGYEGLRRGFVLNNSRQVLTLDDGRTLVLAEDIDRLDLIILEKLEPCRTVGGEPTVAVARGEGISHGSMLMCDGRLHLLYACDSSVVHATCRWTQRGIEGDWQRRTIDVPPGVMPFDLELGRADVMAILAGEDESLWLARLSGGAPTRLTASGRCPVLARAADGACHLAYERGGEIFCRRIAPDGTVDSDEQRAAFNIAFYPAIVEVDGRPLIAFQFDGLDHQRLHHDHYVIDRERCASGIGFAVRQSDGTWRQGTVHQPRELVVRRMEVGSYNLTDWKRPFNGRAFAALDECWRPSLSVDANGVAWVAFANTTRHHVFVARFQGDRFTVPRELRGPIPATTAHVSLEKYAAATPMPHLIVGEHKLLAGASSIGAIDPRRRPRVMFLDELEIAATDGVELCYHHPRKHGQPILIGPEGGKHHCLWWANVVRRPDGSFAMRMNYQNAQRSEWTNGYAASADGLEWRIVERDLFADLPTGLEDLLETDPAKRFKKIEIEGAWHEPSKRRVYYSPDGLKWSPGPYAVGADGVIEAAVPNLYDTLDVPQRRFKMYGRSTTPQGRSCCMQWSGDFVHWEGLAAPVVWDTPFARREGRPGYTTGQMLGRTFLDPSATQHEFEIYSADVWIEHGYYLCLYKPYPFDARYAYALAVSRDGFNFQRVLPDQNYLPSGQAGQWDSGALSGNLLRLGDEVRFYYGAGGWHHGSDPYRRQYIGVAFTERDRWTYYRILRERDIGHVTTVPIDPDRLHGMHLRVNVSGVGRRAGRLRAAILDANTRRSLDGFGFDQCDPPHDGFESPLTWRSRPLPAANPTAPVRLAFELTGIDLKFFGFCFST